MSDIPVKCTRCRNEHMESERVEQRSPNLLFRDRVCPRCGCKSFYDQRPQVAWCWASGLIEIGDAMPENDASGGGAIQVAKGPKSELQHALNVLARHAYDQRQLLVPGVPEARSQRAGGDALAAWLKWCQEGGKGRAARWPGVVWNRME